jgi:hypothetical protein
MGEIAIACSRIVLVMGRRVFMSIMSEMLFVMIIGRFMLIVVMSALFMVIIVGIIMGGRPLAEFFITFRVRVWMNWAIAQWPS